MDTFHLFSGWLKELAPEKIYDILVTFDMFLRAESFNQPLNNWNVSKVTYVSFMFDGASSGATAPAEPAAAPRAQPDVLAPTPPPRPGRARSVATPAPRPRRYATRSSTRRGRAG